MGPVGHEDCSEGQIVVVPHAWRGDGLLADMNPEAQCRIGAGLRALYADLISEPIPDRLLAIILQLDMDKEVEADER
jgi:hypothetical protein